MELGFEPRTCLVFPCKGVPPIMWFVRPWVWAWVPFWNSLVEAGQRHRRISCIQPPGVGAGQQFREQPEKGLSAAFGPGNQWGFVVTINRNRLWVTEAGKELIQSQWGDHSPGESEKPAWRAHGLSSPRAQTLTAKHAGKLGLLYWKHQCVGGSPHIGRGFENRTANKNTNVH